MQFLKRILWGICAVQIFTCVLGMIYFIWNEARVMGKVKKKYKREWLG